MSKNNCFLVIFVLMLSYNAFFERSYSQAQIFIPDEGGLLISKLDNYTLQIWGTVIDLTNPPFETLVDITSSNCAYYKVTSEWNCNNPQRDGSTSLAFYKRVQMSFDPKCDGDICFIAKGHPEYGEICFENHSSEIRLAAAIQDFCGTELRRRTDIYYPDYIDPDESIRFWARIELSGENEFPPPSLYGIAIANGFETSISLNGTFWGPGFTEYTSEQCQARSLFYNSDAGYIYFQVPYGQIATYGTCVWPYDFNMWKLTFDHNIPIIQNPLFPTDNPVVCYPFNTYIMLGSLIGSPHGWPSQCQPLSAIVEGYDNGYRYFVSEGNVGQELFEVEPTISAISTETPFHVDQVSLNWDIIIAGGLQRLIPPHETNLTIFNGFQAQPINFEGLPDDYTIHVGDKINISAVPYPYFFEQPRITYEWAQTGGPVLTGSGRYKFNNTTNKYNEFEALYPGDVQLLYSIIDAQSTTRAQSMPTLIHILPAEIRLVIDSPLPSSQYFIDATPAMPRIVCHANLEGVAPEVQGDLDFIWSMNLYWDPNNYNIGETIRGHGNWVPNFGADFAGGMLSLDVMVIYMGQTYTASIRPNDNVIVLGNNPDRAIVIAYLRQGYIDLDRARQAEVIGQLESNYQQFKSNGWPNVGFDGAGIGIMQLTTPLSPITREDYWNWKNNVDHGKAELQVKWGDSEDWFYARVHVNRWPEPTMTNRLYDTYCRYNGGHYYSNPDLYFWEPCPPCYHRNHDWEGSCGQCDPQNDLKDWTGYPECICKQSGPCYADKAMLRH